MTETVRPTGRELAELNIARAVAPLDDPTMAGFVADLDRVNALGDASPGSSGGSRTSPARPPRSGPSMTR